MAIPAFDVYKCTGSVSSGEFVTETICSGKLFSFLSVDSSSTDTGAYPVAVPATAGDSPNYSYEVALRWKMTAPPNTYVRNIGLYTSSLHPDQSDSGDPTYITVMAGEAGSGDVSSPLTNSASSIATVDMHANYNSPGTALIVDENNNVNAVSDMLTVINDETWYAFLQLKVLIGAVQDQLGTILFSVTWEQA